ncbi:MAG: hypothetical protein V1850_02190 [Candidatus Bathyarchaeota archaeon]
MSDGIDVGPDALVKELLQFRKHFRVLIEEIEDKLMELSKKYEIRIQLEQ